MNPRGYFDLLVKSAVADASTGGATTPGGNKGKHPLERSVPSYKGGTPNPVFLQRQMAGEQIRGGGFNHVEGVHPWLQQAGNLAWQMIGQAPTGPLGSPYSDHNNPAKYVPQAYRQGALNAAYANATIPAWNPGLTPRAQMFQQLPVMLQGLLPDGLPADALSRLTGQPQA